MLPSTCVLFKAPAGLVQQFRWHGQVALGGGDMNMAEISCELGEQALHVCSLAIPGNHAMYGGGVAQVMQPRLITAAIVPRHAGANFAVGERHSPPYIAPAGRRC